jgi:hypothetical protein
MKVPSPSLAINEIPSTLRNEPHIAIMYLTLKIKNLKFYYFIIIF